MDEMTRFFAARTLHFEFALVSRIGRRYCPLHNHETLEVVFHASGEGETRIAGFPPLRFERGTTIVYPPGAAHDQSMVSAGEDWCMHFTAPADLPAMLRQPICAPRPPREEEPELRREFAYLLRANVKSQGLLRQALNQRATSVLLRVLASAETPRSIAATVAVNSYARAAQEFVQTRFREIATIEDVARHVGISGHYLRHVYRSEYGISIKQAIQRARLEHAARLLTHSAMPLKAIAAECGFQTDRYFSTAFRQAEGMPPGEYRRAREYAAES